MNLKVDGRLYGGMVSGGENAAELAFALSASVSYVNLVLYFPMLHETWEPMAVRLQPVSLHKNSILL